MRWNKQREILSSADSRCPWTAAGRRWGYDSVWLHRDVENEAAERLYAKLGYQTQRSTSGFASFTDRRVLLTKQLQPWRLDQRTRSDMAVSGTQGTNGVFVWQERVSDR